MSTSVSYVIESVERRNSYWLLDCDFFVSFASSFGGSIQEAQSMSAFTTTLLAS
jgi:hypothetical protein